MPIHPLCRPLKWFHLNNDVDARVRWCYLAPQPCKLKMIHRPEHRWFWLISCYTLWDGRWSRLSQMAPCPQLGGGSMWRCVVCGSPAGGGGGGAVPGRLAGQLRVICSSCFLFFSSPFGPEKEGWAWDTSTEKLIVVAAVLVAVVNKMDIQADCVCQVHICLLVDIYKLFLRKMKKP